MEQCFLFFLSENMTAPSARLLLPLSLTLSLRSTAAFAPAPPVTSGRHALLAVPMRRGLHAPARAWRRAGAPAKQSFGLALLLGGTATGFALNLRRTKDAIHCEAARSGSEPAIGDVEHRVGAVNTLPGGLVTTEHFFALPLRHDDPGSPRIEVFVRELCLAKKAGAGLPGLLFLQGGPGFPAGRPVSADSGWVKRALQDHRVFLLDQRGTGRSTAVTWESLQALGDADKQAEYVACMRADSIVRDCEAIRKTLLGPATKWSALGQSFGGFCVMTYLSLAPEGLKQAMLTGGIPLVASGCTADTVYRHTYKRAAERTERFYERFPQHVQTLRDIMQVLEEAPQVCVL